jgi:Gas vesicle protein G
MMGFFRLLTAPVTAPVAGIRWVLETLLREAERQLYDVGTIRRELDAVQARYELGEIDEAEFERQEEALLERLLDARAYHQSNPLP